MPLSALRGDPGMTLASSIHPTALCEATEIGAGCCVDAFALIAADSVLGNNCTVAEHVVVAPDVVLSDDVSARSGARVLSGARVGRGAVIGENVVLGGGGSPSKIGPDVFVGANATVLPGTVVSRGAVIEPGSVVGDAVPANAIVRGNPARIVGYVGGEPDPPAAGIPRSEAIASRTTRIRGVKTERLTLREDLRGSLMAMEFPTIPFVPVRLFTVFGVSGEHIRGSHAHRECAQFLVCVAGTLSCVVDDGEVREEIALDGPGIGLYVPPMIWSTQYKYSPEATLLALASHEYDPDDYIRDYDEFLALASSPSRPRRERSDRTA